MDDGKHASAILKTHSRATAKTRRLNLSDSHAQYQLVADLNGVEVNPGPPDEGVVVSLRDGDVSHS